MRFITRTILHLFIFLFMSTISQAQDWANLNRFKKDNSVLPTPSANENRIVFMGNSITESWSALNPSFFEGKPYVNRGIGGQTTPQMLVRFRVDVIDLQPKVVVILAGTNDIAENTGPTTLEAIFDNIASMAELAESHGIKVVLTSVLPAYDYPWRTGLHPNIKIPELNRMIKKYAQKQNFIYLDFFKKMSTKNNAFIEKYTYDGVHPNKEGYEFMGPLTEKAISKALKQK